ncbi:MAG: DUF2326 domain-containing protein [Thermoanaerobaculia bacterium]|jgi:uncharacterized protein YydD (DUF2326 family)
MIKSVSASARSFRRIEFQPGFNLVLADRTQRSGEKDSRNGLGKSSLLRVIHFCLGADWKRMKTLKAPELRGWEFAVELQLGDATVSVSRNTADPGVVRLRGDLEILPISPKKSQVVDAFEMTVGSWNSCLGKLVFDLSTASGGKFQPSFRALIAFFARLGEEAYLEAFTTFPKQSRYESQILNAYLLGLDWERAIEWRLHYEQQKLLRELRKATGLDLFESLLGSEGELEANRVLLSEKEATQLEELKSFKVHPRYSQIEVEANGLTGSIHELSEQNFVERGLLSAYVRGLETEKEAPEGDLERIYRAVGVELPGVSLRRFDEVTEFHQRMVEDRRTFLAAEIERLEKGIAGRDAQVVDLSDRRSELLVILKTHGALDEHSKLQDLLVATSTKLQDVERRLRDVKKFKADENALKREQLRLEQLTREGLEARGDSRDRAVSLFAQNTKELYEVPGQLIIEPSSGGFRFGTDVPREEAAGVTSMKIFCYDLTLIQLWNDRSVRPTSLLHDSTIFEGVDSRQKASAIRLAQSESARCGFQYICMMNSDEVPPALFEREFSIQQYTRIILTDDTPAGRLFGIDF